MISKQQYEAQLRQIFKMPLENKTQDEIARELNIGVRTVSRYTQLIEKRYGEMQRQKTYNTIFLESQLFKNRMLTLYKALENSVLSDNKTSSGIEKAKCAEIAANIAIDVLKIESEGIKAVKELVTKNVQGKNILNNLHLHKSNSGYDDESNIKEYDPNRKF